MIVTEQVLEQGISDNGGYNTKQLQCLGVSIRNNKGWKSRLLGRDIPEINVAKFVSLKNAHLKKDPTRIVEIIKENRKLKAEIVYLKKRIKILCSLP